MRFRAKAQTPASLSGMSTVTGQMPSLLRRRELDWRISELGTT